MKDMKSKNSKKKESCVPLDGQQAERLTRLIIAETRRNVHYGTERKERIAAPSGAVVLF
jgi:hypothetical protein